jgi:hypothetical protein
MNPRELVDHIRSGPAELVLDEPLRFRRRTRSNPCDFNEFLQALQSSETIRTVICNSHQGLSITPDEWVRLVKTLGSINGIRHLLFYCCSHGSRDFHPFQAVADAVNSAYSLLILTVVASEGSRHPDQSGIAALASALREHAASQEFHCYDFCSAQEAQQDNTALDPVIRALPACPHLQTVSIMTKCASTDAVRNILHSRTVTALLFNLKLDYWLAVANEIQHGRNNIESVVLSMAEGTSSEATVAVKAIASAIRRDRNLLGLRLQIQNGFTDEAAVALAEALTVNKTLQDIELVDLIVRPGNQVRSKDNLGARAYEAFSAMLRVNTSLNVHLPPLDTAGGGSKGSRLSQPGAY